MCVPVRECLFAPLRPAAAQQGEGTAHTPCKGMITVRQNPAMLSCHRRLKHYQLLVSPQWWGCQQSSILGSSQFSGI